MVVESQIQFETSAVKRIYLEASLFLKPTYYNLT